MYIVPTMAIAFDGLGVDMAPIQGGSYEYGLGELYRGGYVVVMSVAGGV